MLLSRRSMAQAATPPPICARGANVCATHASTGSAAGMHRGEARTGHGLHDYACHVAIRSPAERTSPRHCGLPLLLLIFGGSRRALPLCGGAGAASNSRRSRRAAKSEREQLTEPEKTFWNNCSKGEPMTTNAKNASRIGPNGVLLPWRCDGLCQHKATLQPARARDFDAPRSRGRRRCHAWSRYPRTSGRGATASEVGPVETRVRRGYIRRRSSGKECGTGSRQSHRRARVAGAWHP